ncbi:reverse transcriptase domain-containing protein [Tanacetum coccineum]
METAAMEKLGEGLKNVKKELSVKSEEGTEEARLSNTVPSGQDTAPAIRECTFAGFMKCNPAAFRGVEGADRELRRFNELALMCRRMVKPERVKNNQKQGNARAMVTAPTDGKLPFGEDGLRANLLSLFKTCYDCGEQGHTRNRCPKKVKQEEVGEVHGRAYAIKDAEPKVRMWLLDITKITDIKEEAIPITALRTRYGHTLSSKSMPSWID